MEALDYIEAVDSNYGIDSGILLLHQMKVLLFQKIPLSF